MEAIISTIELAQRAGIRSDTVREYIEKGKLPGVVKVGRVYVVPREVAQAWLDQRQARLFRMREQQARRRRER